MEEEIEEIYKPIRKMWILIVSLRLLKNLFWFHSRMMLFQWYFKSRIHVLERMYYILQMNFYDVWNFLQNNPVVEKNR